MKRWMIGLTALGLLLGGVAQTRAAVITVDENGNAIGAVFAGLTPDPGPGGLGAVLTYTLPFAGTPGDVHMHDGGLGGPVLDVVRFNGNGTLLFYSDNTDGFDSLGDTPSPPQALLPNVVDIAEVGPEGMNGAIYTPLPGQPGFDPSGPTYNLISDGVATPEPTALTLLAVGIAGMAGYGWRRRNKKALGF